MIEILLGIGIFLTILLSISYINTAAKQEDNQELLDFLYFFNVIILFLILGVWIYKVVQEENNSWVFISVFVIYGIFAIGFIEVYGQKNNKTGRKTINYLNVFVQIFMFGLLIYTQYQQNQVQKRKEWRKKQQKKIDKAIYSSPYRRNRYYPQYGLPYGGYGPRTPFNLSQYASQLPPQYSIQTPLNARIPINSNLLSQPSINPPVQQFSHLDPSQIPISPISQIQPQFSFPQQPSQRLSLRQQQRQLQNRIDQTLPQNTPPIYSRYSMYSTPQSAAQLNAQQSQYNPQQPYNLQQSQYNPQQSQLNPQQLNFQSPYNPQSQLNLPFSTPTPTELERRRKSPFSQLLSPSSGFNPSRFDLPPTHLKFEPMSPLSTIQEKQNASDTSLQNTSILSNIQQQPHNAPISPLNIPILSPIPQHDVYETGQIQQKKKKRNQTSPVMQQKK